MSAPTQAERVLTVDRGEPRPHVTFTPGANCPRCWGPYWGGTTFRDGSRTGTCRCRARGLVVAAPTVEAAR